MSAPLKVGDVVSHNGARREIADIVGGYALLTNNLDRAEWVQLMDPAPRCSCARHSDGTVTAMMCPLHASSDPCATVASVTGKRRRGTIARGTCTRCGWSGGDAG